MKFNYLQSNRSTFKFLLFLVVLGFLFGIYIYFNYNDTIKDVITSSLSETFKNITNIKQNNFMFHLIIISVLIILNIIIIGLPIFIIYYLYEFISLGFLFSSLINAYKIGGAVFGLIYIIINKLIFLSVLSYFLVVTIKYFKKFIKSFKTSKNNLIMNYLVKSLIVLVCILLNDTILYFLGNKITGIFLFLL